jgi:hypothetical protein
VSDTYILEMRNKLKYLQRSITIVQRMHLPLDLLSFIEKDALDLLNRYDTLLEMNKLLAKNIDKPK